MILLSFNHSKLDFHYHQYNPDDVGPWVFEHLLQTASSLLLFWWAAPLDLLFDHEDLGWTPKDFYF